MKKQVIHIFVATLLFSSGNSGFGATLKPTVIKELINSKTDSIRNQGYFRIIKVNPFQTLFCEIPVSFETFHEVNRSTQFQIGFIFPFKEQPAGRLFETMGANGTASKEGIFSYRKSPYNNYGLSFKTEFRKYGRYLYYAPQFMYKFCFYKEVTFPVFSGSITRDQTESKFSNIFGLGFIMGRQSYHDKLVLDWYGGVGIRGRYISVTILKIVDPPRLDLYPNTKEYTNSFYPFINIGLRIGMKL